MVAKVIFAFLLISSDVKAPEPVIVSPVVQEPKRIPSLPKNIISKLNDDLWRLASWTKPCYTREDVRLCAKANMDRHIDVMFTWTF